MKLYNGELWGKVNEQRKRDGRDRRNREIERE